MDVLSESHVVKHVAEHEFIIYSQLLGQDTIGFVGFHLISNVKEHVALNILAVTQKGNAVHETIHGCIKCYMRIPDLPIS